MLILNTRGFLGFPTSGSGHCAADWLLAGSVIVEAVDKVEPVSGLKAVDPVCIRPRTASPSPFSNSVIVSFLVKLIAKPGRFVKMHLFASILSQPGGF